MITLKKGTPIYLYIEGELTSSVGGAAVKDIQFYDGETFTMGDYRTYIFPKSVMLRGTPIVAYQWRDQ